MTLNEAYEILSEIYDDILDEKERLFMIKMLYRGHPKDEIIKDAYRLKKFKTPLYRALHGQNDTDQS